MQTTKFTKKQANVIYRAYKMGKIKMDYAATSRMYNLVNYGNDIDYNDLLNSEIQDLKLAVDAIFENNYTNAQGFIDCFMAA